MEDEMDQPSSESEIEDDINDISDKEMKEKLLQFVGDGSDSESEEEEVS